MKYLLQVLSLAFLSLLDSPSLLHAQSGKIALTPIEFNDALVSVTENLYAKGQEWGKKFNEAYKASDYTILKPTREALERFVDDKIREVKAMKDVKDSKALHQAMLDFLVYEKTMINKAFKPMEALGKNPPEGSAKTALEKLEEYSKQEGVALGRVNAAQEAYAKANGFTIASTPKAAED